MQGSVVAGKYLLTELLGRGGMGSVWRAEHLTLRSPVAVKLMEALESDSLVRFEREAKAAAALRSPHVVQILDHGVDAGTPYIVMELMEGETLGKRLARCGRLPAPEVARLVTHVARAIGRAHELGIVHRDLKPDNVFIVRNDDEELAKVLDFGIVKADLGAAPATMTGALLGTPHYMSPEQAQGKREVDGRTDVWSLCVIAFESLLGTRPFAAQTTLPQLMLALCVHPLPVPSTRGAVPPGFDAWFAKGCAREPAQRFQTAKEAAQELARICGTRESQLPSSQPLLATIADQPLTLQSGSSPNTTISQSATALPVTTQKRGSARFVIPALIVSAIAVATVTLRTTAPESARPARASVASASAFAATSVTSAAATPLSPPLALATTPPAPSATTAPSVTLSLPKPTPHASPAPKPSASVAAPAAASVAPPPANERPNMGI